MHFAMTVALPEGESVWDLLDPFCESIYSWHEDWSVTWPDWKVYPEWDFAQYTFYDWLCLWWRRDGYIKWKRWAYPEIAFDLWEKDKRYPEIDWKWRWSAFIKKYIKWFGFDKKLSKYPQTYSYFDQNYLDENWELDNYPERFNYIKKRWETREQNEYDEAAYQKEIKEREKRIKKWYNSIPDDYVIYIIDYHI